jgi:hypothetical protein
MEQLSVGFQLRVGGPAVSGQSLLMRMRCVGGGSVTIHTVTRVLVDAPKGVTLERPLD